MREQSFSLLVDGMRARHSKFRALFSMKFASQTVANGFGAIAIVQNEEINANAHARFGLQLYGYMYIHQRSRLSSSCRFFVSFLLHFLPYFILYFILCCCYLI